MQMDETTQQNAALVEEAAAASQAIVEQVQALNGVIARFNVGDEGRGTASKPEARSERRSNARPWSNRNAQGKPATAAASAAKAVGAGGSEWSEF